MKTTEEKMCSKCVLTDRDDPSIVFDSNGVCNHCLTYDRNLDKNVFTGEEGKDLWKRKVEEIKAAGRNKAYDCILGVSGGVDSSYLALLSKEAGLRVLCVHLDNGWNSKEASSNIKNIVRKLGFDLYTHVIDWEEFRDIQLSYFKAGVLDLDVPTDHAMLACLYDQAIKNKTKYILSGHNYVTESVLPANFNFDKGDSQNLINIHKQFGTIPIKTFPVFSQFKKILVSHVYSLKSVRPLNMVDYNKEQAKKTIIEKIGWKDYGSKHYENIFTRFYQGYILPERFGIDKRKAHLSNLICSEQITKEQALEELKGPVYNLDQLKIDRSYILNKFGWTEQEFTHYMTMPKVAHEFYGLEKPWSHLFGYKLIKKLIGK